MRISLTARDKYLQCPRSYKLHYRDNLRPVKESSALKFGSALDNGLNHLLLTRNVQEAQSIFWMDWAEWENKPVIDYFKSDLDINLLTESDCNELDSISDPVLKEHKANWKSLYYKGLKLIQLYNDKILPSIEEVIAVQKEINITNEDGDNITGIIDLIAKIKLDTGEVVVAVLDNKSTSSPYPKNSYATKHQTALYTFVEGIEYAGFLTVNKKEFKHQIIVGKVPEEFQEKVLQEFVDVIDQIKAEQFPKIEKKNCFAFGQRCSFYNYCWNNEDMRGLYVKEFAQEVSVDSHTTNNTSVNSISTEAGD